MDFQKFLRDNRIKKTEIAKYLGVGPSCITAFLQRGLPEKHAQILRSSNEGWDLSALDEEPQESAQEICLRTIQDEIELLKQIVNNQTAIIARYEALMNYFLTDNGSIQD